jgi:hypothetical protein
MQCTKYNHTIILYNTSITTLRCCRIYSFYLQDFSLEIVIDIRSINMLPWFEIIQRILSFKEANFLNSCL